MGELSVFVDESGDFGALAAHCPFYIDYCGPIATAFHA